MVDDKDNFPIEETEETPEEKKSAPRFRVSMPFSIEDVSGVFGSENFASFDSVWDKMPLAGVIVMQVQYLQGFQIPMLRIGATQALVHETDTDRRNCLRNIIRNLTGLVLVDPEDLGYPVPEDAETEKDDF